MISQYLLFLLSGFSFAYTDGSLDGKEKGESHIYLLLPFPPVHISGQQAKGEDHMHSLLLFPPIHKRSYIYFQFCIWEDYLLFSILVLQASNFTKINTLSWVFLFFKLYKWYQIAQRITYLSLKIRSLLKIYYIYFTSWFYTRSYYNDFLQTSGKFEIASTIIPPLQTKRPTKWASYTLAIHICD